MTKKAAIKRANELREYGHTCYIRCVQGVYSIVRETDEQWLLRCYR